MIMTAQLMTLGDILLQPFGISQLPEDVQCAETVKGTILQIANYLELYLETKMELGMKILQAFHTGLIFCIVI